MNHNWNFLIELLSGLNIKYKELAINIYYFFQLLLFLIGDLIACFSLYCSINLTTYLCNCWKLTNDYEQCQWKYSFIHSFIHYLLKIYTLLTVLNLKIEMGVTQSPCPWYSQLLMGNSNGNKSEYSVRAQKSIIYNVQISYGRSNRLCERKKGQIWFLGGHW